MDNTEDRGFQILSHLLMILFSILCIVPFILIVITSFTDEGSIINDGYSYFPVKFSFSAYNYLIQQSALILNSYLVTIGVTVIGTTLSIVLTSLTAYPLSRLDLPHRNKVSFFIVFTLLFNGGLVPSYLTYTQLFNIKNSYLALIVPNLLLSGFTIMIVRTYFVTNLPKVVLESAKIDGANELRLFFSIVLPMSLPIFATIGLLQGLLYWNDWFNGFIYLTEAKYFSLQNLLNRIIFEIQFLSSNNLNRDTTTELPSETVRMAMASIAVVPILCIYPFFQKYFIKGIIIGAVKG